MLGASIGFFLSNSSVALFSVFCAMSLVTWGAALAIRTVRAEKLRTGITAVTIVALAATLILYKEIAFVVVNSRILAKITGLDIGLTMPEWIAPLGISYFTLILIGYLLDVRWGTIDKPQKNPLKFLLFAGYFPHMVSGPFSRYNDMNETLLGDVRFSLKNVWFGLQRVIWGVFKVLVISTRLSVLVSAIYDPQSMPIVEISEHQLSGSTAIVAGALLYVLTVYMNFSGSMDIVIGVSEMLGIPLAENFRRPFSATSLSEVWRKWHMTLGLWLKDYVMYPVQKALTSRFGKRAKKLFGKKAGKDIILYTAMFVVWFCVGFWHGGSWKYICASGLFFFVMIVGGLILDPVFQSLIKLLHINTKCNSWRLFQRVRTVVLFSMSVSFGRAESLTVGLQMWKNALLNPDISVIFDGTLLDMGLALKDIVFVVIALTVVFAVSHLQEHIGSMRVWLNKQNILFRIVAIGALLAFTFLAGGMDNRVDFIYGNF
jgi:D-alanyl-lipoteichoic acid acyltransferase DltB (MBOAT superfamily)